MGLRWWRGTSLARGRLPTTNHAAGALRGLPTKPPARRRRPARRGTIADRARTRSGYGALVKKKRVCIVGGGASGVCLAWLATFDSRARAAWEVTLLHDEPFLGGHSHTVPVTLGGRTVPVDIGVQFITPTLYPHVTAMLALPEIASRVEMAPMPPLTFAAAFTPETNWTTNPDYAKDPRFSRGGTAEVRAHAAELMNDLSRALFTRVEGEHAVGVTLEAYFRAKPHLRRGDFFALGLMPLLSIINGYTAHDILETRLGDLFPLTAKLPLLAGPLIPFDRPGTGLAAFRQGGELVARGVGRWSARAGRHPRDVVPRSPRATLRLQHRRRVGVGGTGARRDVRRARPHHGHDDEPRHSGGQSAVGATGPPSSRSRVFPCFRASASSTRTTRSSRHTSAISAKTCSSPGATRGIRAARTPTTCPMTCTPPTPPTSSTTCSPSSGSVVT
jgi:hypothetical protein